MDDVVTSIYSLLHQEQQHQQASTMTTSCVSPCIDQDQPLPGRQAAVPFFASISEEVIELNDKAVACMLKNDHQGALDVLQVALARIMSLPTGAYQPSTHQNDDSLLTSVPLSCQDASQDGIFVLFHRAFTMPHHQEDWDLTCPKNRSRALVTILYNIALVYHLEALARGDSNLLSHALTYYGWAYYSIESCSLQFGFHDVLLPLLALFNNMGHVHATLMNGEKTRQCLKWMQSTFATHPIQQQLHRCHPDDYQFFFQYISVVAAKQLQLAPAA